MRIAGLDPGKRKDSFTFVGTYIKEDRIYVDFVHSWLHRKYIDVEEDIANIHKNDPYDFYVLEINNTGEHVFEELKYRHKIPNIVPVFTTRQLKDQFKIAAGKVMPKNEMVRWMASMFQDNKFRFPKNSTKQLDELRRQIAIFAEHSTEAGNESYYAEGDEHDDAVMALMMVCFVARNFIKRNVGRSGKIRAASKPFRSSPEDIYGSGVPPGGMLKFRAEIGT